MAQNFGYVRSCAVTPRLYLGNVSKNAEEIKDAISALEAKVITLHDKIVVRDEKGKRIETTVGRIIFNEAVRKALA